MSLSRKIFRFGSVLTILQNIYNRIQQHAIKPVKLVLLATLADIFGMLYLLMDHPLFFAKVGLLKWKPTEISTWDYWTDFMWFIEVVLQIPLHLVSLADLQKNIVEIKNERTQLQSL